MTFDMQTFWEALTSSAFLNGALITIALAAAAQATAVVLGLFLALGRDSRIGAVRWASWTYIWFFRAIPTLLQLLFVWNALPQLIPELKSNWFTPFLAGYIALALNEAAYMAEITRSGLLSVDPGQKLAARALGMTPWRTLRRITIPQTIRVAIPPTANEFITLLKLTSLTSVISLRELMTVSSQQVSLTFAFAELYAAAAVYYLAMVSVLMFFQARLERRYRWTSQGRQGRLGRLRFSEAR
jgi:polar amino acid transport system permease protein